MRSPELARTSIAIAFALAMLALGTLNPNGHFGKLSCGLVCDQTILAPR